MTESYVPPGIEFFDQSTNCTMRLVTKGHDKGWLVRKQVHGDNWIAVRGATEDDKKRLLETLFDREIVDLILGLSESRQGVRKEEL